MKLIVSGKTKDFTPELEDKFTAKLSKLSKFIEQRGEREAHVTHQVERHLHKVEVVVNFYDHALVGAGADADLDTALCHAIEKLEKQIVKVRSRWRDTHRDPKGVRSIKENGTSEPEAAPVKSANGKAPAAQAGRPKIFHVNYEEDRKPMTLQEAMLEMERDSDNYVVYRDASRNCLSVLVRRADGNFDLIES
ncbi:MAG TPA: ribosome-associated translation inhibitor RaiA [Bryobacteraceae bacterium]|jgi:putative sigma-54 modulation protein|nr:ribosome-associated translation inhibitor RaiA [Bryobacteraceae bacterium]